MKMSGYFKEQKNKVKLIETYKDFDASIYDDIYISKVFDYTKIDENLLTMPNVHIGGTGFYFDSAPPLPYEIEHHMPDYHLYDSYIKHDTKYHRSQNYWHAYTDYSMGFTTRGCFRRCPFCVNRNYTRVERHSPVSEFFDPSRRFIYLLDDNILGYTKWQEVFDELEATDRYFTYMQGLDLRLMNDEKARRLANIKYKTPYMFAFDNLEDAPLIERKLEIWRKHCAKETRAYVLSGYAGQGAEEIDSIFRRIEILMKYKVKPYIMRHENYLGGPYEGMFKQIASWCNQPQFLMRKSLRQFAELGQLHCKTPGYVASSIRYVEKFERENPEIAAKWLDRVFSWTMDRSKENEDDTAED